MIYIPHIPLVAMFWLMFIFGFFSSTYALSFALANTCVPPSTKGVSMGFINMLCIAFGAPLYQPLIGFLLKVSCNCEPINKLNIYARNDYAIALSILPISLFLSFILAFFIKEGHRSGEQNLEGRLKTRALP